MHIKRGANGKLRCVVDGHSYVVHTHGRSFNIVQKGAAISCTRIVNAFLKGEAASGGQGGRTRLASGPMEGRPFDTLPSAATDAVLAKLSPGSRKALGEASRTLNTTVKLFNRHIAGIAAIPIDENSEYKKKLERLRLTKDELRSLHRYISEHSPPLQFGQQQEEDENVTAMEAYVKVARKLAVIDELLAHV